MYSKLRRLDDVDHEVAAGPVGRQDLDVAGRVDFAWCRGRRGWSRALPLGRGWAGEGACAPAIEPGIIAAAPVTAACFRKSRRSDGPLL